MEQKYRKHGNMEQLQGLLFAYSAASMKDCIKDQE